jgi:outer membrane protein
VKYFSIILNFVLAIAIIVLYVLFFSLPQENELGATENSEALAMPSDIAIAYVLEDSLLSNYEYFKELAGDLDEKRKVMENDYTLKAQGLQKEFEGFQRTAGNMTMNQARAVEEDLMQKRQNLILLQERMGQDLLKAEAEVNSQLYDKVSGFLEKYAKENGFALILNVKRGNAVLYGDKGMDITNIIVKGLNDEYNSAGSTPQVPSANADTTATN